MARARKLFPVYGSALANSMLLTIQRDRVVENFVAAYVDQNDRQGILSGPARRQELAETVGREILLAMIVHVREALPAFFGKKQRSKLKVEEAEAVDAFFHEFLAATERAHRWQAEDRRQFRRDLALYTDFRPPKESMANKRKGGKAQVEHAPFTARVALLLDPSMLEEARAAARKFQGSVDLLARKLLRQTISGGRR